MAAPALCLCISRAPVRFNLGTEINFNSTTWLAWTLLTLWRHWKWETLPWTGWRSGSQLSLPLQSFLSMRSEENLFSLSLFLSGTQSEDNRIINPLALFYALFLELSILVNMISDCSSALLQLINFYLLPFLPLLLEPLVGIDSDLTNYNTLGIRLTLFNRIVFLRICLSADDISCQC